MVSFSALRTRSERYHMHVHAALGVICALSMRDSLPSHSIFFLIFVGIMGNLLPDLDHLFYFFIYGRRSEYSKQVRLFLRSKEIRNMLRFWRSNHKMNNGLITHNLLTPVVSFILFKIFQDKVPATSLSLFFLSFTVHFVYDVTEDLLVLKKLNPNWYLKFNNQPKEYKYHEKKVVRE